MCAKVDDNGIELRKEGKRRKRKKKSRKSRLGCFSGTENGKNE